MKKLLILFLLLTGIGYSATDTTGTVKYVYRQTLSPTVSTEHFNVRSFADGNGFWFYDSLWTGDYILPNDTTFSGSDTIVILDTLYARTSVIIPLNFNYDWLQVAVYDTGTTYDDSLKIERGIIRYSGRVAIDTVWHGLNFRDSTNTDITTNIPVDDDAHHLYTIWDAVMGLYKITITNVEAVINRATYIWGAGKKANK